MRASWDKYYAKFRAAERRVGLRRCPELRIIIRFALDEFGYVPIDVQGARLLFQVMSECYERRSMIITTNIEFSKWGVVLGDDKLASALIDRKCEASHLRSNAKFHIMRSWADGIAL